MDLQNSKFQFQFFMPILGNKDRSRDSTEPVLMNQVNYVGLLVEFPSKLGTPLEHKKLNTYIEMGKI